MENTTNPSAFKPEDSSNNPIVKQDLPNAQIIMIIGIGSIVLCCCYGSGLIPGIISLIMANKAIKTYNENPMSYTESSLKNIKTGRICGIVAIALSVIYIGLLIVSIIVNGVASVTNPRF